MATKTPSLKQHCGYPTATTENPNIPPGSLPTLAKNSYDPWGQNFCNATHAADGRMYELQSHYKGTPQTPPTDGNDNVKEPPAGEVVKEVIYIDDEALPYY